LANKIFRWGIIGPGRIAEQFARGLTVIDGACLYAVASSSKQRAQTFALDHGAPVSYDSYQALYDDPNIDAIYIATPHRFHFQQARECLLAGKPVLCEKPLTVNATEAQELITLSKSTGVFLMEAMWTRYLPIYQQVKAWLDAGKIGSVTKVSSSFGFEFPRNYEDRVLNHELAGGALLDLGIYNLSLSQWIFSDQPTRFSIKGFLGGTHVDEHDEVLLNYSNGRTSDFVISLNKQLSNNLIIKGNAGKIEIDALFANSKKATLTIDRTSTTPKEVICVTEEFRATGFEYETEEAVQCIQQGLIESPRMPHKDTLAIMKLMDQLRKSIGLTYSFEQHEDIFAHE